MCFLNKVDVSRMLIRDGNRLFKLAPYQLKEILNFQDGKEYKREWLYAEKRNPYFLNNNGKKYIVYIV